MKKKLFILCAVILCMCTNLSAQWVVSDPGSYWRGIVNTGQQLSAAAKNLDALGKNITQVRRLADQYKEYYDKLKEVNKYVSGAKQVYVVMDRFGNIMNEYTDGITMLSKTDYLSSKERSGALRIFRDMLKDGNDLIAEMRNIALSSKYEMSDAERLNRLDEYALKLRQVEQDMKDLRKKTARIIESRSLINNREKVNDRMWGRKKGVRGY